ncbi:MAG: shikimate kinase [Phycisphaerales bacterium]|nr:shikimate kinase [Phycisphaerales bacterium]
MTAGAPAPAARSLVLMGLRGSGKSTLGRALARSESVPFVDLDERTLARLGCAHASEAFARLGEPAFRAAEAEALREVLEGPGPVILALGGGTPTAPGAAGQLAEASRRGWVIVYLRLSPVELRARLSQGRSGPGLNRPSLTGGDPLAEIDRVFAARDGVYARLATRTLEGLSSVEDGLRALTAWRTW